MKAHLRFFTSGTLLAATLYALPSVAHDPKEHQAQSAKPDCAAMENMDASKMDMNDPVMIALSKKCMNKMGHSGQGADGKHEAEEGEAKNTPHKSSHGKGHE